MSYYGYKERKDGFVDVGGKITEFGQKYQKERLDRQKRRDDIDADTQKAMSEMAELESSNFDSTNDIALKAVNEARDVTAEAEIMFKNGQMSESQFALTKQSAMDDMSNLKGIISGINTQLTEKSDGTAGNQLIIKGLTENLDALKGGIKFGKDGRGYIEMNGKKVPLRQMQQKMGQKWSNVDLGPTLDATKDLGVFKQDYKTYGTQDSARFNTEFEPWLESTIDSFVSDDDLQKTSSILTENGKYKLTRNPDEVDDMTILVDENNQPQLTDEQKQAARDIVEDQIKVRIGMNRDSKALDVADLRVKQRKQSEDEKASRGKRNKLSGLYQLGIDIFEAKNPDEFRKASSIIKSNDPTIIDLEVVDEGDGGRTLKIVRKGSSANEEPTTDTIPLEGDKLKTVDSFVGLLTGDSSEVSEAKELWLAKNKPEDIGELADFTAEDYYKTVKASDFDDETGVFWSLDEQGTIAANKWMEELAAKNPKHKHLKGVQIEVEDSAGADEVLFYKMINGKKVTLFESTTDETKMLTSKQIGQKIQEATPNTNTSKGRVR